MSLRNLLWFYRLRLRARIVQELFALVGIAAGVALLFAVQVSSKSLNASIVQLSEQIVGDAQLQLVARGPEGFGQAMVERVEHVPGVKAAAPIMWAQANVVGPSGQRAVVLLGATPGLARLGGDLLRHYDPERLGGLDAVVLPSIVADGIGVRFTADVTLQIDGRATPVPVGGVAAERDVGALASAPVIVAPLSYAQSLAGMDGRVSRVYVLAAPGRLDEVEAGLRRISAGRVDVRSADSDAEVFRQAASPNDRSAQLFAGISAFVGFLFAFNAMLLMARERRGVIADLRMSGYNARAVLRVLLFDAIVLGVAASAAGLVLGEVLSRYVFHPAPGYLSIAFPVGVARIVDWQTVLLAFGSGTAAAVLAVLPPLVSAARAPAMDAIEDGTLDEHNPRQGSTGWRPFTSIACLAGTTAILILAPAAALLGVALLVLSMLFALPVIMRTALKALDRLRRRFRGIAPAIAIGELMSSGSRSVGIAAIAAIAVFSYTAIEGAHRDLVHGIDPNAHELNAVTDLWVSARGASNPLATTPFDATRAIARLARVPEVASVHVYRGSFLDIGNRRAWVIAPPPESTQPLPPSQVVQGNSELAAQRVRQGGWAAVSEAVADQLDLYIGQRFVLPSPRPTVFRLAAITTNFAWAPGAIVVNAENYRTAWGTDKASALHLGLSAASSASGRRSVEKALAGLPALTVESPLQREERDRAVIRDGLARLTQIATLVLIAAALAMAAATGGMVWQRRRQLADLKLVGINHRELWKAILLESATLLGLGGTVGAIYGMYGQQLLDRALSEVTGFPVDYSFGFLAALTSLVVVTAVASAIAMLPGWFAARVPADVALRG